MTPADTDDELLARLLAAETVPAPRASIPRRPAGGDAPLSFGQRRLWFLDRLTGGGPAYNISAAFRLRGPFDPERFGEGVRAVARRHDVLRTVFLAGPEGEPVQRVLSPDEAAIDFACTDVSAAAHPADAARAGAEAEAARPFDLEKGPLARVRVWRTGPAEHVVACTLHHIVSDGWSTGVLVREIGAYYAALAAGREPALPPLAVQYADYAAWQRAPSNSAAAAASLGWWRERLAGLRPLELPTDFARGAVQRFRGARLPLDTGPAVRAALAETARRAGTTLFAVVLAVYQAALAAWSGQRDFAVGAPVAGRPRRELEPLIGFFVNTLVLRAELAGDPTFDELVRRTGAAVREALARQDAPFDRLVEELNPTRQLSTTPLVQAVFAFEPAAAGALSLPGLELEPIEPEGAIAKFDLTLGLSDSAAGLRGGLDYDADLFAPESIAQFAQLFQRLLAEAGANPASRLPALLAPHADERAALDRLSRGPALRAAPAASAFGAVLGHAAAAPDRTAVRDADGVLSYGELAARARGLAGELARHGAGAETIVAICLPRSRGLVVAQLAAWLAGAAYLPVDPAHPGERLRALAEDAQARVIVTDTAHAAIFAGVAPVVDGTENAPGDAGPVVEPPPAGLAYVIHTSGTTGRPKGVAVSHGALANLVAWHREAFALQPGDRVTLLASPAFDASVWELWPALAAGASVTIPPPELLLDPPGLRDWLVREAIAIAFVPTPLAELLLALPWPAHAPLRWLLTGGDRLRKPPASALPFRLSNNYGPTEHAVVATSGPIEPGEPARPPDLGRPIARTRLYLLDPQLRPVPAGAVGEIHLSGPSLARGYLGLPALTAERFLPDPFADEPGARMYRTGDLARWRPDGRLEFRGRADQQVKIRGVRIELGEIEAALLAQPGIAAAVAGLAAASAEPALAAWLVAAPGTPPDETALRAALRRRLPPAMIPTHWTWVERLPLTPNGKVDRAALPAPAAEAVAGAEQPDTPLETAIAEIWSEVLGRRETRVNLSFFDAGGHSLLLIQVQQRLQARLGRPVPVIDLFAHPTIRALAAHLAGGETESAGGALAAAAQRGALAREARQRRRRGRAGETSS